ncbi:hypothetical protein [Streptomyces sp. NPDC046261]|uniref:hypothetical protein n=1 Tax=Streptomyces sp. NPDC046261 TaxID=3157200 RepID=UPI0033EB6A90
MVSRRFHLDLAGHSVSVLVGPRTAPIEVLVDGKVVACGRAGRGAGVISLETELPGEPPQPVTVLVSRPKRDDAVMCALQAGNDRYLMPEVPLAAGAE